MELRRGRYFALLLLLAAGCNRPSPQAAPAPAAPSSLAPGVDDAAYFSKAKDMVSQVERSIPSLSDSPVTIIEKQGTLQGIGDGTLPLVPPMRATAFHNLLRETATHYFLAAMNLTSRDQLNEPRDKEAAAFQSEIAQGASMLARAKTLLAQLSP